MSARFLDLLPAESGVAHALVTAIISRQTENLVSFFKLLNECRLNGMNARQARRAEEALLVIEAVRRESGQEAALRGMEETARRVGEEDTAL